MKKTDNLTERIVTTGLRCGADLVGVASVENIAKFAPGCDIAGFLPGATGVVIALVADPPGITDTKSENEYNSIAFAGYQKADAAAFNIIAAIKRAGSQAELIARSGVNARDASGKMVKAIPLKQCAQAAGLGSIGLHSLLINETYGPRIRMSGVITDAALSPSAPSDARICDNCNKCARECPSKAIPEKDGKNSLMLCSAHLFAGIRAAEIMSAVNVFDPQLIADNARTFGSALAGWADSLSRGRRLYYTCGKCLQVCNVHERKAALAKRTASVTKEVASIKKAPSKKSAKKSAAAK